MTASIIYGYLRESSADGDLTPEGQMRDCRALAVRYGYDPEAIEWVDDFGQSGRRLDRPGYVRIKDAIAAGRVIAVLARSVDRLGRDAREQNAFEALAISRGARILTDRDGERTLDPDTQNTLVRWLPALLAEEESRLGRDRARRANDTKDRRRAAHLGLDLADMIAQCQRTTYDRVDAHGQVRQHHRDHAYPKPGPDGCALGISCQSKSHWGQSPPYGAKPGDRLDLVIAIFRETGSYNATAAALNDMGIRPPRGRRWEATTVQRILTTVEQIQPDLFDGMRLVPVRSRRQGVRAHATHVFSQLVECPHCPPGNRLTSTFRRERNRVTVGYFCRTAKVSREHPRPWAVSERVLLPYIVSASDAVLGITRVETSEYDRRAVEALRAERRIAFLGLRDGHLNETEYDAEIARVDAGLARWASVEQAVSTWQEGIDWSGLVERDGVTLVYGSASTTLVPPTMPDAREGNRRQITADVNVRLREVLSHIVLGEDFRPKGVVWLRQPEGPSVSVPGGWYLPHPLPAVPQGATPVDRPITREIRSSVKGEVTCYAAL